MMGTHQEILISAKIYLVENEKALFLGQSVAGTAMSTMRKHVPEEQLIELPVDVDF